MSAFEDALAVVGGDAEIAQRCWDAVNGEGLARINPKMALCVLDTALVLGEKRACRLFQQTVHVAHDGVIGKVSLACYRIRRRELGDTQLLEIYLERRARAHQCDLMRDPTQRVHRSEWMRRVNALCDTVGIPPVWSTA